MVFYGKAYYTSVLVINKNTGLFAKLCRQVFRQCMTHSLEDMKTDQNFDIRFLKRIFKLGPESRPKGFEIQLRIMNIKVPILTSNGNINLQRTLP